MTTLPRLSNAEIQDEINDMDLSRSANTFYRFFKIQLEYARRQDEKQDKVINLLTQLLGNQQEPETDRLSSLDHNE